MLGKLIILRAHIYYVLRNSVDININQAIVNTIDSHIHNFQTRAPYGIDFFDVSTSEASSG